MPNIAFAHANTLENNAPIAEIEVAEEPATATTMATDVESADPALEAEMLDFERYLSNSQKFYAKKK